MQSSLLCKLLEDASTKAHEEMNRLHLSRMIEPPRRIPPGVCQILRRSPQRQQRSPMVRVRNAMDRQVADVR